MLTRSRSPPSLFASQKASVGKPFLGLKILRGLPAEAQAERRAKVGDGVPIEE